MKDDRLNELPRSLALRQLLATGKKIGDILPNGSLDIKGGRLVNKGMHLRCIRELDMLGSQGVLLCGEEEAIESISTEISDSKDHRSAKDSESDDQSVEAEPICAFAFLTLPGGAVDRYRRGMKDLGLLLWRLHSCRLSD